MRWFAGTLRGYGHWLWNGYSIIAPQECTFNDYELMPYRGDVGRFQTLEQAKRAAIWEWTRRGFKPGAPWLREQWLRALEE